MPLDHVMVHELEPIWPEELLAEDRVTAARGPSPLRFAVPDDVEITPETHGTWEVLADGGRLWRLRIASPNATDLNFGFSRFRLPEGATLVLVSEDHGDSTGPYGAEANREHGELWTPPLPGDRAIVELYVPANPIFEPELELGRIGRGYRNLFGKADGTTKQATCNVDAVCPEGDDWRAQIQSVARVTVGGQILCSGTMIMDAEQSFRPYFLTAHHCEIDENNDQSVVTVWNYQSPVCGNLGGGSAIQSLSGSTLRARRADVDFALVELEETPPDEFHVFWSGWDRRESHTPQGSMTIHHPYGDEKALSLNDDPLTLTGHCDPPPDVTPTVGTHFQVYDYEAGTTEAGSSGGGLWDSGTGLYVGHLTGGNPTPCASVMRDCFGRFARAWDGDDASQRLRDWLDPQGTGAETVTGAYEGGGSNGDKFSCGNAGYDQDFAEAAVYLCEDGCADDPDYMFAVRFRLADFGYSPGQAQITGFCASNSKDYTHEGGPWPNEIFLYPDDGGLPDDSQVLAQGTIVTGDGTGDSVVTLPEPFILNGDFWLVVRGDPMHAGQYFNVEHDAGPNVGNSYISNGGGINGLDNYIDPDVNFMLRATLEPVGGTAANTYLAAGIARIAGLQGASWRSKVAVLNRSGGSTAATLSYVRPASTSTVTVNLNDGELAAWDNVLEDLFGLSSDSSGALKVESERAVVVTARTYNQTPDGTFGQFLPGVTSNEALGYGEIGLISQLTKNSSFRTNIGFINLSLVECQVEVQLHDALGNPVGTAQTVEIGPMGFNQVTNIFGKAGAGRHDNAYARVEILTPHCQVWGYASVIDESTNDATTVPMVAE
jgi:hypothetical protein